MYSFNLHPLIPNEDEYQTSIIHNLRSWHHLLKWLREKPMLSPDFETISKISAGTVDA